MIFVRQKLFFTIFWIVPCILIAQKNMRDNQLEGYIITADGQKSAVAIEVEDIRQPWTFQENVKYFDLSLMTGSRIKREDKKICVPGEIKEFGFGGRRFVFVNYYIKGKDDNALKSAFGKFKGEKNTEYFAEVIREGKVSLLKFYIPPVTGDDEDTDEAAVKAMEEESTTMFDILITREGEQPKSIEDISFKTFFKDCPFVVKKYEEERYKIKPSKGLKSLIKSDRLYGIKLETASRSVVDDFEKKCAE